MDTFETVRSFAEKQWIQLSQYVMSEYAWIIDFLVQPWVLLSLGAAFGYAIVGFIDERFLSLHSEAAKGEGDGEGKKSGVIAKLVIISGLFGLALSAFFAGVAIETSGIEMLFVNRESVLFAMLSGALEVFWLVPYFVAMRRAGAIDATPLFQTVPVFAFLIGLTPFFNEVPTTLHIIGSAVLVLGSFILNMDFKRFRVDLVTILLMFLSSTIIALEYFLFKEATATGNFISSVFWSGIGMFLFAATIWTVWAPYRRQFSTFLRSNKKGVIFLQLGSESINAASMVASQQAITIGPSVMLVSAFNAFHPVFTMLIGMTLALFGSKTHRESLSGKLKQKLIAILLLAIGTVIVAI